MGSILSRGILRLLVATALLAGCGAIKYTVDDGRAVDEKLLAQIRTFGRAEEALRPAVMKSAELRDGECDKQWELPFAVASSQAWQPGPERVAWVRALKVDERPTVIATTPGVGLVGGDRIVEVDGYHSDDAEAMIERLAGERDRGRAFVVKTAIGKAVTIKPVEVCRGHVLIAPPNLPAVQDYHWLMSVHPLEVFQVAPTFDEALWVVLWTQGLSEEAGARMKTYHYGKKTIGAILTLASFVSAVGAVSQAAKAAASAAATSAASNAAAREVANQVVQQIGQEVGKRITESVTDSAYKMARQMAMSMALESAANRAGLNGVSWVAGTAFDQADQWAFVRLEKLGADPLGAFTLHSKLVLQGHAHNAFVFDEERLGLMKTNAIAMNRERLVARILNSTNLDEIYARPASAIDALVIDELTQDSDELAAAADVQLLPMESFPPESRGGFLESIDLAHSVK